MRTIKFRAKNGLDKWVYGSLVSGQSDNGTDVCFIAESLPVGTDDFEHWNLPMQRVKPETIGQFIGLHDMKGMEIYEGDVLMIEGIKTNRYSKVWWNPDKFTFYIGHSPMDAYLRKDGNLCEFCIVGNIYDNPELIQEIA